MLKIEVEPPFTRDLEQAELLLCARIAAPIRLFILRLNLAAGKILFQDEIHHASVGRKTEPLRDFLGQHLDPAQGFGWIAEKLAETADPDAVDKKHRSAAAAPARRSGCRL